MYLFAGDFVHCQLMFLFGVKQKNVELVLKKSKLLARSELTGKFLLRSSKYVFVSVLSGIQQ